MKLVDLTVHIRGLDFFCFLLTFSLRVSQSTSLNAVVVDDEFDDVVVVSVVIL